MTRAVFLDRDGVINRKPPEGDYIIRWADFDVLPGVAEGIAQLKQAGFCVIVVTNQRCIAKGLLSEAELEDMHKRMCNLLSRNGAVIDGIYYCPHEVESHCNCRKPAPGMLVDAAREHGIDLTTSWMIGDSDTDIEAGRNAACKTALIVPANETNHELGCLGTSARRAEIVTTSLFDAVSEILRSESVLPGGSKQIVRPHRPAAN
jgi:D-glycero-D-manno-heptose 1,7-bisphosphate phosphatase